jgi:hypothetical protein
VVCVVLLRECESSPQRNDYKSSRLAGFLEARTACQGRFEDLRMSDTTEWTDQISGGQVG